jgi:cyclase
MLATRVIPVLLRRGHQLVKGVGFDSWRSVGHALQAIRVYQSRDVDELVVLDVAATPEGRGPDLDLVKSFASDCFMPVTVGGGVRSCEDIRALLAAGADKVAIGTAAIDNPDLIAEASRRFGAQAVTVAIDVKAGTVWSFCGSRCRDLDPVGWATKVAAAGAGEILLTSVERDGSLAGYDLDLIRSVSEAVSIPVVAAGGAGTYEHLAEALQAGAHAVAAGAMWQFTDATPQGAARYLASRGFPMRLAA